MQFMKHFCYHHHHQTKANTAYT